MNEIIYKSHKKGICSTCGTDRNVTDYEYLYEGNYVYSSCDRCSKELSDRIAKEPPLCLAGHNNRKPKE